MALFSFRGQKATVTDRSKVSRERLVARIGRIREALSRKKYPHQKKEDLKKELVESLTELDARQEVIDSILESI